MKKIRSLEESEALGNKLKMKEMNKKADSSVFS